jgi:hypothetical protein
MHQILKLLALSLKSFYEAIGTFWSLKKEEECNRFLKTIRYLIGKKGKQASFPPPFGV